MVEVELAVISKIKGAYNNPQYDPVTKRLYMDRDNYEDAALLQNGMYKVIFNLPKYRSINRLPIVKISYKSKSIYRRVELNSACGFVTNILALTPKSITELTNVVINSTSIKSDRPQNGAKLTITVGCAVMYYWCHPNSATRMSFRLGLPSLIVGLISIVVSIISFL